MRKTDDMGELGELLRPILDDPETMEKLSREAERLGLGDMLPRQERGGDAANDAPDVSGAGGDIGAALGRLAPLLSGMSREDESTRLLRALRPFLGEKRGKRLDEAENILMIMRVLRLLRESGSL